MSCTSYRVERHQAPRSLRAVGMSPLRPSGQLDERPSLSGADPCPRSRP